MSVVARSQESYVQISFSPTSAAVTDFRVSYTNFNVGHFPFLFHHSVSLLRNVWLCLNLQTSKQAQFIILSLVSE